MRVLLNLFVSKGGEKVLNKRWVTVKRFRVFVLVALALGEPEDKNVCVLLEWVEPNERLQALDHIH